MPVPAAATISVRQTLDLLDGQFASFAKGVAEGQYAFWLGSGISLGRVPGLRGVIAKVVEFLRGRIDHGSADCKFRQAIGQVLDLASTSVEVRKRCDLYQPFETWPNKDEIVQQLQSNYARLLGLAIDGEEFDFLIWNAVDVRGTYGDPGLTPDVEHLCLGALCLEGAASDLVSANWDPLIERAVSELTDSNPALVPTVVARPQDIQLKSNRTRLVKLHGCAALATTDEAGYRQWLVARHAQVVGWCERATNAALVTALVNLVSTKPTFMLGLSVQDANIQQIFARAANQLKWQWPSTPPSYVFSENELGIDQRSLLHNVYGEQVTPTNLASVLASAHIQAFAKPLLTALLLHVIAAKLEVLADLALEGLPPHERLPAIDGVTTLRNAVADAATPTTDFVDTFTRRFSRASQRLRLGRVFSPNLRYQAVTPEPLHAMQAAADLVSSGVTEAAVVVGLVGAGLTRGDWTIEKEAIEDSAGLFALKGKATGSLRTKVFITSNPYTAALLRQDGHVSDSDGPILIQAKALIPAMARAPRAAPGRTGRLKVREVSVETLVQGAKTFDQLYDAFRRELTL